MNPAIRTARHSDVPGIVTVAAEVWPEETFNASLIERLVDLPDRATSVAELDGSIVGFVDGFLTETATGEPRWEVDLLAVSPHARGEGIGRELVRASIAAGMIAGATRARGLIRIGNVASERVFAACGFNSDAEASQLWVAEHLIASSDVTGLHVVPVQTFRYEGRWLEAVTEVGLRSLRSVDSSGVTGAVIPVADVDASAAAAETGLQPDGQFRFWHRDL